MHRIAQGRDIDVLEIDAATNTQVEKVREIIIEGLGIMPVRNRYKVFIIDEVHQLSSHSFNALLKSIEEPPPHAVFMMATTELDKIPETILSRSQVLRAADDLDQGHRRSAALHRHCGRHAGGRRSVAADCARCRRQHARRADKLDQVIAFTGNTITADDVGTVLGLVGRDLLFDTLQAVADEDAVAAFALRRTCGGDGLRPPPRLPRAGAWSATSWCCRSIRRARV
ncbi:MAG: AAA family ATPase [Vicinamibacterales bacterium]